MGRRITQTIKNGVRVQDHSTLGLPKGLTTFNLLLKKRQKQTKKRITEEITRQIAERDRKNQERITRQITERARQSL